jgi:hypothetical protein
MAAGFRGACARVQRAFSMVKLKNRIFHIPGDIWAPLFSPKIFINRNAQTNRNPRTLCYLWRFAGSISRKH